MPGVKANTQEGAFYIFPDISYFIGKKYKDTTITSAHDLCLYLLSEAMVALVSGESFGATNCIRISYAASEETLVKAMTRVKEALAKLA